MTPPTPPEQRPDARATVVIGDADPLARSVVAELLQADGAFAVAAHTSSGREAAELGIHYGPDLLVVASNLTDRAVTDVIRAVIARRPDVRAVVLTGQRDDELALDGLRAGASGVVDKQLTPGDLRAALGAVHAGQPTIPPELTMRLIEQVRHMPVPGHGFRPIRSPLTNREWEVLDLLMGHAATRDIADALVLTEDTVYSHIKSVMRKLGVHSRAGAVSAARALWNEPLAA